MKLPYAEDVNYWKTGQSNPDKFLTDAVKQIEGIGGKVMVKAEGQDENGNNAFLLMFTIEGQQYKVVWPVLKSKYLQKERERNTFENAAKRQAATFIFHDIKAKCMVAKVLGARPAFFQYMMLPDGRTATEASNQELVAGIPNLFKSQAALGSGIVEGEYE